MKKYLPLALAIVSPSLLAQPYLQLGLGVAELDHDEDVRFADGTELTPDSSESAYQITLGQRFNQFGVELSYRAFEGEDSTGTELNAPATLPTPPVSLGFTPNEYEEDYDASLEAKQFALQGRYFYDLNPRLILSAGAGVTYTDYELSYSHTESWELDIEGSPDREYDRRIEGGSASEQAWGGIASLGVAYQLAPQALPSLTLGADVSVAVDKYSSTTAALVNLGWNF